MSENTSSSTREQRLQRVLADYQHAVEAGNPPDPEELLRRHPDLAGDLAAFFGNRATAEYLPERLPQGPGVAETPRSGRSPPRARWAGQRRLVFEDSSSPRS